MAKLIGPMQLQGTVSNLTFAKTKHGNVVKLKNEVSKERIRTDPAFESIRAHRREFAAASAAGSLMRGAFCESVYEGIDKTCHHRLCSRMMRVVQTDRQHRPGERTVQDGNPGFLEGFEFNEGSQLHHRFFQPCELSFDRQSGLLRFRLDLFRPDCSLDAPRGASHCAIIVAAALADFAARRCTVQETGSGPLYLRDDLEEGLSLDLQLAAGSPHPLIVAMGLEFYELVSRAYCPLDKGKHNSLGLVRVEV